MRKMVLFLALVLMICGAPLFAGMSVDRFAQNYVTVYASNYTEGCGGSFASIGIYQNSDKNGSYYSWMYQSTSCSGEQYSGYGDFLPESEFNLDWNKGVGGNLTIDKMLTVTDANGRSRTLTVQLSVTPIAGRMRHCSRLDRIEYPNLKFSIHSTGSNREAVATGYLGVEENVLSWGEPNAVIGSDGYMNVSRLW